MDRPEGRGITSYERELAELAELETFDPNAFRADEKVPADVCDVVLSLALLYNDYKDIVLAQILLDQAKPRNLPPKSRIVGAHAGIDLHLLRLHVAQVHALLEFVRENRGEFDHPFFQQLVRQLPRGSREAWDTVIQVAEGADPKSELGRSLMMIRHKVTSHYDHRMLRRGYKRHFLDDTTQDDRAYLSRGDSMATSRFYFADAAALGVVRESIGCDDPTEFIRSLAEILRPVNLALIHIVIGFIQLRRFAFRSATKAE